MSLFPGVSYGKFSDFLLKDEVSVTLELKLSLEKELKSLFWVSQSSYNYLIHHEKCLDCLTVKEKLTNSGRC